MTMESLPQLAWVLFQEMALSQILNVDFTEMSS